VEEEAISWVEEEAGNLKSPDKHVVDKCKSHVNKTMDKGKNPVRKIMDKGESLLKKTMNKDKSKVLVDDIPVKKHVRRNNGIVIEENVNPVAMDTDSDSEKGEDEMIDLRKRRLRQRRHLRNLTVKHFLLTRVLQLLIADKGSRPEMLKEPEVSKESGKDTHILVRVKDQTVHGGLKEGWKLGCRNVIALDGFFLKKPNVDLLGDDLDMPTENGLTLISYQHKGFRKQFSGVEFRSLFWAASKASYPGLFNKIMHKIKRANPKAYQYLLDKDPKTWSRAYFRIDINNEAVKNGFSECFNSVLLRVRNKPLITMLEAMQVIVLERMNTIRRLLESWSEDICPNIHKRLEVTKDQHRFWHVIPTGENLFQVRNGSQAFRVDEEHRTCTCRLWQLSGLPCAHAIAVIFKLNRRVEDYVLGHNKNGCKNSTVVLPPKPPTKKETAATQSSQAQDITPHIVVPDISPRPRSERILNKKLAKNPSRIGSSNSNSLDLE
nr:pentatricopeptide repeat-containing protein [Tanacetum cinerariifolium]